MTELLHDLLFSPRQSLAQGLFRNVKLPSDFTERRLARTTVISRLDGGIEGLTLFFGEYREIETRRCILEIESDVGFYPMQFRIHRFVIQLLDEPPSSRFITNERFDQDLFIFPPDHLRDTADILEYVTRTVLTAIRLGMSDTRDSISGLGVYKITLAPLLF